LLSVCVDYPHFSRANLLIDTNKLLNCSDLLLALSGLAWLNDFAHNSLCKRALRHCRL
jgi:hypothetical protein